MILRRMGAGFAGALLGALIAAHAGALESASGSYEGKLTCKGIDEGERLKTKSDVEIGVSDDGNGAVVLGITDLGAFLGFLLTDTKKPETGTLSAVNCTLSAATQFGRALHAEVKIKAGSDKASLQGKLIRMDQPDGEAAFCEFKAKRVSALPPVLEGCP